MQCYHVVTLQPEGPHTIKQVEMSGWDPEPQVCPQCGGDWVPEIATLGDGTVRPAKERRDLTFLS